MKKLYTKFPMVVLMFFASICASTSFAQSYIYGGISAGNNGSSDKAVWLTQKNKLSFGAGAFIGLKSTTKLGLGVLVSGNYLPGYNQKIQNTTVPLYPLNNAQFSSSATTASGDSSFSGMLFGLGPQVNYYLNEKTFLGFSVQGGIASYKNNNWAVSQTYIQNVTNVVYKKDVLRVKENALSTFYWSPGIKLHYMVTKNIGLWAGANYYSMMQNIKSEKLVPNGPADASGQWTVGHWSEGTYVQEKLKNNFTTINGNAGVVIGLGKERKKPKDNETPQTVPERTIHWQCGAAFVEIDSAVCRNGTYHIYFRVKQQYAYNIDASGNLAYYTPSEANFTLQIGSQSWNSGTLPNTPNNQWSSQYHYEFSSTSVGSNINISYQFHSNYQPSIAGVNTCEGYQIPSATADATFTSCAPTLNVDSAYCNENGNYEIYFSRYYDPRNVVTSSNFNQIIFRTASGTITPISLTSGNGSSAFAELPFQQFRATLPGPISGSVTIENNLLAPGGIPIATVSNSFSPPACPACAISQISIQSVECIGINRYRVVYTRVQNGTLRAADHLNNVTISSDQGAVTNITNTSNGGPINPMTLPSQQFESVFTVADGLNQADITISCHKELAQGALCSKTIRVDLPRCASNCHNCDGFAVSRMIPVNQGNGEVKVEGTVFNIRPGYVITNVGVVLESVYLRNNCPTPATNAEFTASSFGTSSEIRFGLDRQQSNIVFSKVGIAGNVPFKLFIKDLGACAGSGGYVLRFMIWYKDAQGNCGFCERISTAEQLVPNF